MKHTTDTTESKGGSVLPGLLRALDKLNDPALELVGSNSNWQPWARLDHLNSGLADVEDLIDSMWYVNARFRRLRIAKR